MAGIQVYVCVMFVCLWTRACLCGCVCTWVVPVVVGVFINCYIKIDVISLNRHFPTSTGCCLVVVSLLVANEPASFSVGTNTLRGLTYLPTSYKLRPYKKVER